MGDFRNNIALVADVPYEESFWAWHKTQRHVAVGFVPKETNGQYSQ